MDRLTAQDMSMLWPDDFGWPQDIGVVGVLAGDGLVAPDGGFRIELARTVIGARLPLVPRFRQVIRVPRLGLGRPLWVDARSVDLQHHVRVADVCGDLLPAVERIRRRPLDRTRPLWEVWFLTGLPDGRVGCYVRAHHAIADGVAGVAGLAGLLAGHPIPNSPPRPEPSARDLFVDNLRRYRHGLARSASRAGHPLTTLRGLREAWPGLREIVAEEQAPRMSFNHPLGPDRTLAVIRERLDHVREIAHAHEATVNDVLLAAITGGLRDLLLARGEPVADLVLRAFVPVALRREEEPSGNRTGAMVVPLPVGVADPVRRLRLIAAETAVRRARHRRAGGALFPNALLQRAFLKSMARQRWVNIYVTNVPGPPEPLHVAGVPLLNLFPVVPLLGNVTLGVGALSYAGQFNLTVVADPDACPDAETFTAGLRDFLTVRPAWAGDTSTA